jgi:general secretion pathway protein E
MSVGEAMAFPGTGDSLQEVTVSACGDMDFIDFLLRSGRLDATGAGRVRSAVAAAGHRADTVLLELGLLPEGELAAAQAQYLSAGVVEPEQYPDRIVAEELIPRSFLHVCGFIPLSVDEQTIVVAAARPLERESVEALSYYLDRKVDMRVARRGDWEEAFRRIYEIDGNSDASVPVDGQEVMHESDVERLKDIAREAPVIRWVNSLIGEAVQRRASDIHIEPLADKMQVRFRIDGILVPAQILEKSMHAGVTSRIKILARLNIAERRLPQDGRIALAIRGREIDFRVSTVPTLHGESVVLRVLDRKELQLDLPSLGFGAEAAALLSKMINQPNGIVLVSGPTGSGKTTTLYAAICELRRKQRKILTIEDPVEYHLDHVIQTQVKPQIGLDFAACLRAFLRQDPDIIMVGEIRDAETAKTAVQASLTGHLVLSTVHTNSAAASVSRLIDMGVEDYLLVSTLRAIVAQRLVRKLCTECREARPDSAGLLEHMGLGKQGKEALLHEARGCQACGGSGYRGRTSIYEIMPLTTGLQKLILGGATDRKLEEAARSGGMRTLWETGIAKAIAGETSIDEVLRVTSAA